MKITLKFPRKPLYWLVYGFDLNMRNVLVTCLPITILFFLLKENLFLNHSRTNRTTFIGCWTALCHPWSVEPPKNLSLSSRLNFTWRPLSMRFTGSGTTSIPRQTSTIFQVQVFVCYSIIFLLKSCMRMLLLVIILSSRKGESRLISIAYDFAQRRHHTDMIIQLMRIHSESSNGFRSLITGESLSSVRLLVKEMPSFKLWEITGCKSESKPKHVFVLHIQG